MRRKAKNIIYPVFAAILCALFVHTAPHVGQTKEPPVSSTAASSASSATNTTEPCTSEPSYAETAASPYDGSGVAASETVASEPPQDGIIIPQYAGEPYELINNNVPSFTDVEFKRAQQYFEDYSPLDNLGRVGVAEASFGPDTIPTKKRGDIGNIKPTGWKQAKYKGIAEDGSYDPDSIGYLYNRAHCLMFALGGNGGDGSDNGKLNLITGTRYMNVQGMLPFENKALYYVKDTGDRVLYRVTPIFDGNELVCRGVHMECASVSDKGQSLSYNVFVFNVQPHVTINYADGSSYSEDGDNLYAGKS